jgi:hypothetical protein
MKLLKRRIHAVAQVLRRVDKGAVKVEDQQLELLNRDRP